MGCFRFGIPINAETEEIKIIVEPPTGATATATVRNSSRLTRQKEEKINKKSHY